MADSVINKANRSNIKIWDDHNKQWLEPISIFFGKDGVIWRIEANKPGEDPLTDGWYKIYDEHLSVVAVDGVISHNVGLIPDEQRSTSTESKQHFRAPQHIISAYKEWLGDQDEDYALDEIHNFFNKLGRGDKFQMIEFLLKFDK